jgi:hypothetical protein
MAIAFMMEKPTVFIVFVSVSLAAIDSKQRYFYAKEDL